MATSAGARDLVKLRLARLELVTDCQTPRSDRANLSRDVRASCLGPGNRDDMERSANANSLDGPASGRGASPSHRRGQSTRWVLPRQARSRLAGAQVGPPALMLPRPGQRQAPGSMRAFLSPLTSQQVLYQLLANSKRSS